jgi:Mg/Co/Ni transporter MgtE
MRATQMSARQFAANHPADAAALLEQYALAEAAAFLDGLPASSAAAVLCHMSQPHGAACLASMEVARACQVAAVLAPSRLATLLRRLPPERRRLLLDSAPAELRHLVDRLVTFADGTVGAVTDPDIVTMPRDRTVAEAIRWLRRHSGQFHDQIYAVGENHELVGVLHMSELMRADSKATIASLMQKATVRLPASGRLVGASFHPAWNQMDAIPVVDDSGTLVGVVRHRHIRRMQTSPGAAGLVDALLQLGELYWVGLTTFFPMAAGVRSRDTATDRSTAGADHEQ